MTDPMELVGRLESGSDRFLKWAYKEAYSGAPVISIPRHPDNIDALLTEAAACIREMVEWRPIETAPTQKTVLAWLHLPKNPGASGPVLAQRVYFDGVPHEEDTRYQEGCWWANGRYYAPKDDGGYVTHWLPLPPAPGAEA